MNADIPGSTQPRQPNLSVIGDISKFASALGVVLLVLSSIYDVCFLLSIGLRLSEVPTTIADHVRSALVWAPQFTFATLGGGLLAALLILTQQASHAASTRINPSDVPRRNWLLLALRFGTPVFMLAVIWLIEPRWAWLFPLALLLANEITIWALRHVAAPVTGPLRMAAFMAPIVILGVAFAGYMAGAKMLLRAEPQWKLVLKTEASEVEAFFLGIRRFSEVVVAIDPSRIVHVIPASAVLRASMMEPEPAFVTRACDQFGQGCAARTAKPAASAAVSPGIAASGKATPAYSVGPASKAGATTPSATAPTPIPAPPARGPASGP